MARTEQWLTQDGTQRATIYVDDLNRVEVAYELLAEMLKSLGMVRDNIEPVEVPDPWS